MNWDAMGALGEIVGAAAVFISLVYLALQIRQGTELARTQIHSSSVNTLAPFLEWKAANPENGRIFAEGMLDFYSLKVEERVMLDSILHVAVLSFKDVLEAQDRGFIDEETYLAWEGFLGAHLRMPGGATWWNEARNTYIKRVQEKIDHAVNTYPAYNELVPSVFKSET